MITNEDLGELPGRAVVLEALQEVGQQLQPVAVLCEYTNLLFVNIYITTLPVKQKGPMNVIK